MNIINKILKYGRTKKEQKELNFFISIFYNKLFNCSNLSKKQFIEIVNDFLKQYDNLKFLSEDNEMFILEKSKYRKLTRDEKLKFLFPKQ